MQTSNSTIWQMAFILLWVGIFPRCGMADEHSTGLAREHYYQGVFYGKQEKYVEAVFELEKAIELNPAYADAYNALAVIYHRQKQYQEAINFYLLAIETQPSHVKARTNLAMAYYERGNARKALRHAEQALQSQADYTPAQTLLSKIKKKIAEQDAQELARQQASAAASVKTSAAATPILNKPVKSVKKEKKSAPPLPASAAISVFQQGTRFIRQGRLEAGIEAYRRGLKHEPQSADGHALLGLAYRMQYDLTRDITWREHEVAALNDALRYNPRQLSALLGLAEVYYEEGVISKAFPLFQQALQQHPANPAAEQIEWILRDTLQTQ